MHYKSVRNSQAMNGVPGMNGFLARSATLYEWIFVDTSGMNGMNGKFSCRLKMLDG